jgi:FkbM family methyltransferase
VVVRDDDLPHILLEARWTGPVITSYAQNAEDIRLWRVLSSRRQGFYVDVGAGHPVVGSVTKLFYDAGWSGVNIEPGPHHTLLADARPRDVNLDIAISNVAALGTLWVTQPDPGLTSLREPDTARLPEGFSATGTNVQTKTLASVLSAHSPGQSIDFLKIDVEGAERSVLESFDLRDIRPTVLLVEAISPLDHRPSHEEWEGLVLHADYIFAAFDGINRFYVPQERVELAPVLAYPISPLDRYVAFQPTRVPETADHDKRETHPALPDVRGSESESDAARLVREMEGTISWRVTRPLRTARRLQRSLIRPRRAPKSATRDRAVLERAFIARVTHMSAVLGTREQRPAPGPHSIREALELLAPAIDSSSLPASVITWLGLTAAVGQYPEEDAVEGATRLLRSEGPQALVNAIPERFARSVEEGVATGAGLRLLEDLVVVDASHAITTDHHTGIQRVVRETLSRWVTWTPTIRLAVWDDERRSLLLLTDSESQRLVNWRAQMNVSGAPITRRRPIWESPDVLVPLGCHLVVPEVPHRSRTSGLRGLVRSGVIERLSVVGFDLIPVAGAETMVPGMADMFCEFLSLVKRADKLSAISVSAAESFQAFNRVVMMEGLNGPVVRAHPLPTEVPTVGDRELADARRSLEIGHDPVVLVVGSNEPRKNHLAVLEAAERLWSSGIVFELLMIGGGELRFDEFRVYADRLHDTGRPLNVRKRVTDTELWAAYKIARFSVFPSLLEGYGLPVAESLASGTPVITSSHGSMAEIAVGGGALLVDPRNVDEIESQMGRLLTDDELHERLTEKARARDLGSWDDYAREVWDFFTSGSDASP